VCQLEDIRSQQGLAAREDHDRLSHLGDLVEQTEALLGV
jgi:hypothetical protein